ncbi:hypothetical protein Baya_6175 [Bagarius yarrelli]|uniref:Uncharacterized protein n=1 Tax=Bagarius yarrelli TaxID=175774 RepID=A0A556U579_BAGYA|nr:hypothetical protein Baya_6175 [Bagarius yarrelli]
MPQSPHPASSVTQYSPREAKRSVEFQSIAALFTAVITSKPVSVIRDRDAVSSIIEERRMKQAPLMKGCRRIKLVTGDLEEGIGIRMEVEHQGSDLCALQHITASKKAFVRTISQQFISLAAHPLKTFHSSEPE